jgi:Zn-dependent oligopeptidase
MDIRFLKDLNRHFFSRYAGKQLAFDREKVKTRLAFFLKMKKIWDRLYYSNFVNRIVYPHSSSEHKSYFDLKLTNSTENLNDFLLFNKY